MILKIVSKVLCTALFLHWTSVQTEDFNIFFIPDDPNGTCCSTFISFEDKWPNECYGDTSALFDSVIFFPPEDVPDTTWLFVYETQGVAGTACGILIDNYSLNSCYSNIQSIQSATWGDPLRLGNRGTELPAQKNSTVSSGGKERNTPGKLGYIRNGQHYQISLKDQQHSTVVKELGHAGDAIRGYIMSHGRANKRRQIFPGTC
ncbi:uncharacterized protein M421DRAFT_95385 [Didymella exigua CBS 183.55]|uniref:Uncharacterized protein n=1 Tax=Didymella exigua CBS 183.55 TaxID=1150837 RepID=A0A6A5RCW1_9PLEO|nr:uncharacterized protein M421DRAFT_95385 [Didymella exigua CBS 183.55]KAF1924426.1 hypothetical protein M421DRAFT_95385 [Didymella exigua CBS 183.55]